jgi:hypothetical protein
MPDVFHCLCSGLEKKEGSTSHAFDRDLPTSPFAFVLAALLSLFASLLVLL